MERVRQIDQYWERDMEDFQDALGLVERVVNDDDDGAGFLDDPLGLRLEELGFDPGPPLGDANLDEHINALLRYIAEDGQAVEPDHDVEVGPRPRYAFREPYSITALLYQTNWFERSMTWKNKWFRRSYRMSKATFDSIVVHISKDPEFLPRPGRPQRPVLFQLGVFLLRYGTLGSDALEPALKTSIGEGSVFNYCRRVVVALLNCQGALSWPDDERKQQMKDVFGERMGIDGVIGIIDVTHTNLTFQPTVGGRVYFDRKKNPSISIQAICDHQCRFINYQTGWAGSANDKRIWLESHVWRNRDQFFSPGEFLLGDMGYPTSTYLLRPYAENELRINRQRRREFNRILSRSRVLVECAFGRLKSRFPALKFMAPTRDMDELYRAVGALLVLHNLCYDYHDTVHGLPDEYTQGVLDRLDRIAAGQENEDEDYGDMEDENPLYDAVGEERPVGRLDGGALVEENILRDGETFREQCVDIMVPE